MAIYIIIVLISYLIGSISFAIIFGKKFAGIDVREKGSGNAGSTNVLRTAGKKAGAITLLCDVLKGVVAITIAYILGKIFKEYDSVLLVQLAAIAVALGHTFPIFFGFKGGKGVATSLGIILIINWQIGLICLAFWLVIVLLTRMVSLGSIGAAILFPILTIFIRQNYIINGGHYFMFATILALLIVINHNENIKRLFEGNENKISL